MLAICHGTLLQLLKYVHSCPQSMPLSFPRAFFSSSEPFSKAHVPSHPSWTPTSWSNQKKNPLDSLPSLPHANSGPSALCYPPLTDIASTQPRQSSLASSCLSTKSLNLNKDWFTHGLPHFICVLSPQKFVCRKLEL